jgi:DNA-binding transcriptional MocR family regulator
MRRPRGTGPFGITPLEKEKPHEHRLDEQVRQASRMDDHLAIREILKVAQSPDVISMAGGWPEADLFPVDQLRQIADYVLANMPRESLQYGLTEGLTMLRAAWRI